SSARRSKRRTLRLMQKIAKPNASDASTELAAHMPSKRLLAAGDRLEKQKDRASPRSGPERNTRHDDGQESLRNHNASGGRGARRRHRHRAARAHRKRRDDLGVQRVYRARLLRVDESRCVEASAGGSTLSARHRCRGPDRVLPPRLLRAASDLDNQHRPARRRPPLARARTQALEARRSSPLTEKIERAIKQERGSSNDLR